MTALVQAVVPVVYVQSLTTAVGFYEVLGFQAVITGQDGDWSWWYGRCGQASLLIAQDGHVKEHRGPVQLYLHTDDVDTLHQRLLAAGVEVEHLGYPDSAPGGQLRTSDPDGRVIMISQTAGAGPMTHDGPHDRASFVHQAAEALRRRGQPQGDCQVPSIEGSRCPQPAQVKIVDTWGEQVWACLAHADEVLFTVPNAFLATEDAQGLSTFLTRRARAGTPQHQPEH